MDFVTRQFIVLAKKLREDVRHAASSLRVDLNHIQNAVESINETAQAYEHKEQPKPELFAVLHTPEAEETEHKAHNKRSQRRDRIRLFIECLTLFAVAGYGYVAVRQWREMVQARHQVERAIVASNRTATAAETANAYAFEANRPWIGPMAGEESPEFQRIQGTNNAEFRIVLRFQNAGKRPAIIRQLLTVGEWHDECTKHPVFKTNFKPGRGLIIPDNYIRSPFSDVVSRDNVDLMVHGKIHYCVYASIEYEDVGNPGVVHHTTTCANTVSVGADLWLFPTCSNGYEHAD